MTASVTARFYQPAHGAPLQVSVVTVFPTAADWAAESADGVGVKATAAAPTNVSDFGGHILSTVSNGAAMDRYGYKEDDTYVPGGTVQRQHIEQSFSTKITLDSNWAAGRYAFAYTLGAAGAVVKASPPFLIR